MVCLKLPNADDYRHRSDCILYSHVAYSSQDRARPPSENYPRICYDGGTWN